MPKRRPLQERFFEKVQKTDSCWLWTGAKNARGYGSVMLTDKSKNLRATMLAHRLSWILHYGERPDGLHVLHKCDHPACVNPEHLWLGTHADNMRDKAAKGRAPAVQASGEAHQGAKLTADQVAWIRRRYAEGGVTLKAIADDVGVCFQNIAHIVSGKTWKEKAHR